MSVAWTIFAFLMGGVAVLGVILLISELTRRKKADEDATQTPTPTPTPPDSPVVPSAPSAFAVTTLDHDSVLLTWLAPTNNGGSAILTYVVYVDEVQVLEVDAVVRTLTLHSIAPGTYVYSLRARNSVGEGAPTNGRIVTLSAPTPTPGMCALGCAG